MERATRTMATKTLTAASRPCCGLARQHRRLTQAELGAAMGVSYQQVQKYEQARSRLSVARLVRATRRLDVPVAALLAGLDDNEHGGVDPMRGTIARLAVPEVMAIAEAIAGLSEPLRTRVRLLVEAIGG